MNIHRLLINAYLKLRSYFGHSFKRPKRTVGKFFLYYRICDHGYPKEKPYYITKEHCLKNAVMQFPLEKVTWCVFADNVCDDTYQMICNYIPKSQIRRVKIGHGAGTFRLVYEEAIKNNPDDFVYFLEDDYLHLDHSLDELLQMAKLNVADYMTLYDHPDKYGFQSLNSFLDAGGERTVLFWSGTKHWKITNSTTMTFAAYVDVLKRDQETFWRWTESNHPFDFQIFNDLNLFRHRILVCPIPSLSTHGETAYLAKGIDWNAVK